MDRRQDIQEFHSAFQMEGGSFDIRQIPGDSPLHSFERIGLLMCDFVEQRELLEAKRLIFGYLDYPKLRAISKIREAGFVSVSIGAATILLHTFFRLLSDKTFLADLGHSSLESDSVLPSLIPISGEMLDLTAPIPRCNIRFRASIELASLAFQFLVAHEITHVEQGHLPYLQSLRESDSLDEEVLLSSEPVTVHQQALELIADYHGAARVLRRSVQARMELNAFGGDRSERRALRAIYGEPFRSVYFVMFSIATAWRILDVQNWDESALDRRTHPPVPARQLALNLTVGQMLERIPDLGVPRDKIQDLMVKAQIDAHVAYLKLAGQKNDLRAYDLMSPDRPTLAHLMRLMEVANDVTMRLREFAWGWPGEQVKR